MTLLLTIPEQDVELVTSLGLPVELAVLDECGAEVVSATDRAVYSVHELATRCIGTAASSATGMTAVEQFLPSIAEAAGTEPPPLCDLTRVKPEAREAELLRFLTESLTGLLERQARRSADLSRSLATLRQSHSQMQAAFAQVEKFVLDNNLAQRTDALSLLPGHDMAPLELREGDILVQRLPISSAGLSDVAVFIEDVDIADQGTLSITLLTKEDDKVRGHWTLSGPHIKEGPVRLALHSALEASALTPILELSWEGEGALWLATSLSHPDPRLQARIGGRSDPRVLALRCWSYLPDSKAPIPASAHLPADPGTDPRRSRILDDLVLGQAEDLTPESKHSRFLADKGALLVHPMPQGVSAMRLSAGAPAGTVHLDARIRTLQNQAPMIEYAMGIAPSEQAGFRPQTFEPDDLVAVTPWVTLSPQANGELHLPLETALSDDHDLVLMTRLAVQPGDTSWAWSTFSRIRFTVA